MPAVQCVLLPEAIIHMLSSSCVPASPSAAWSANRELAVLSGPTRALGRPGC